jgi:DNA-directed RNA polymerase subunit RPC12/RpoP
VEHSFSPRFIDRFRSDPRCKYCGKRRIVHHRVSVRDGVAYVEVDESMTPAEAESVRRHVEAAFSAPVQDAHGVDLAAMWHTHIAPMLDDKPAWSPQAGSDSLRDTLNSASEAMASPSSYTPSSGGGGSGGYDSGSSYSSSSSDSSSSSSDSGSSSSD